MKPQIAILDFGSQYTHLIARRIRQLGVLAKIYSPDKEIKTLPEVKGIILSGGPQSVYDSSAIKCNKKIFDLNIPILGLCYGHQLLAHLLGGKVKKGRRQEYGLAQVMVKKQNKFFKSFGGTQQAWMSHGDSVVRLPKGFLLFGKTLDCPIAAMGNIEKNIYGLQFHPEVTHTKHGIKILNNFIFDICKCNKDWSLESYLTELTHSIKKLVGTKLVFLVSVFTI